MSKQFLGLPLSIAFDPVGLSGTVRWSRLLFNEDVSSLDKEFKNPLSDAAELFSRAWWLFASEGVGEWHCTANAIDGPATSAADELLASVQDCLPLAKVQDEVLVVFMVFSRDEKEDDGPLSEGKDEEAFCDVCFAHIKSKRIK